MFTNFETYSCFKIEIEQYPVLDSMYWKSVSPPKNAVYLEQFTEAVFLKQPFLITSTHCHSVHKPVMPQVNFPRDVKTQIVTVPTD